MRQCYRIIEGRFDPTDKGSLCVYTAPTAEEREHIKSEFEILDYDIDAALDPDEIPRIEFDEKGAAIIWKRPYRGGEAGMEFSAQPIGFFLRGDTLTVVSNEPVATFVEKEFVGTSSTLSFLMRYFFFTIKQYLLHLKAIKQITAQLEVTLTQSIENSAFLQMFNLSESLVYYHTAVEANGSVLEKLRQHADKLAFSPRQMSLLDDAILENNQCARQVDIYTKVLSGLMDARGNIVNNNMNVLLKNLTIINVVFLPLNLVASIGGMSEYSRLIDTYGLHWEAGYALFTAAMVIIAWCTWILLRRFGGVPYRPIFKITNLTEMIKKIIGS